MLFNSPISIQKVDQIIDTLTLAEGNTVLDAGCGTGEFLIRVVERKQVHGLGVDEKGSLITAAIKAASGRVVEKSCRFKQADINSLSLEDDAFDLAACIGSTHAYGFGETAYPNTIQELTRMTKPGGLVLIGEAYWKQEPAAEYLELIGEPTGIYRSHAENIWYAERQGLIPLYATVSNEDEWDHFEGSHLMRVEQADQNNAKQLAGIRKWRDGYLKWGRSTMGFGFYLFQKPAIEQPA